jgi:hypothetical protein
MPRITHDDVLAEVSLAFPATQRDTALTLLNDLADALHGPNRDADESDAARLELAIVRLSGGHLDALRDWVARGRADPGAALAAARRAGYL